MRDILIWAATVEILGLACLPLLRAFFGNRRDAALLSRPVGLALTAYTGWAFTYLFTGHFDRGTLLAGLTALAAVSVLVHRRSSTGEGQRQPFWGAEEKLAALLFWGCAAVFLAIRAAFSEIAGQEKFMDLAFFNSLTRNGSMPPLDPWMAGKRINYYYWGYLLAAVLAKLSGVTTFVSYNLAIPTFAGYSFVAAACLGFRLSAGRLAAGVWAAVGTVFAGNLAGAFDALKWLLRKGFNYWDASRVIGAGKTINEFPFFTFFQADLHPHLLAFPYFIAAFAVAHRYLEFPPASSDAPWTFRRTLARAWPPLLVALIVGTARAANNWNLPALAVLLLFVGAFRSTQGARLPALGDALWGALLSGGGLLLASLLLWMPYSQSYALPAQGLGWATMKSLVGEFLKVWGIFFVVAFAALLPEVDPSARRTESARRLGDFGIAATIAASVFLALEGKTLVFLVMVPLVILGTRFGWNALRDAQEGSRGLFTTLLFLLAVGMIAGCEFIYFKDKYGADLQRMNTIFKFYHQAWPLLAIAVAVLGERAWRQRQRQRRVLHALLAIAIAFSLLYPAAAFLTRVGQRQGFTLDARKALARREPGDAAAIDWLIQNVPPGSVVMEATGEAYSEYARISSHTGIPTVLGWSNHESLWRGDSPDVTERAGLIRAFYSTSSPQSAYYVLQKYRVTHVVLGDFERRRYPLAGRIATLPFLQPVLNGRTTVYRVLGSQ